MSKNTSGANVAAPVRFLLGASRRPHPALRRHLPRARGRLGSGRRGRRALRRGRTWTWIGGRPKVAPTERTDVDVDRRAPKGRPYGEDGRWCRTSPSNARRYGRGRGTTGPFRHPLRGDLIRCIADTFAVRGEGLNRAAEGGGRYGEDGRWRGAAGDRRSPLRRGRTWTWIGGRGKRPYGEDGHGRGTADDQRSPLRWGTDVGAERRRAMLGATGAGAGRRAPFVIRFAGTSSVCFADTFPVRGEGLNRAAEGGGRYGEGGSAGDRRSPLRRGRTWTWIGGRPKVAPTERTGAGAGRRALREAPLRRGRTLVQKVAEQCSALQAWARDDGPLSSSASRGIGGCHLPRRGRQDRTAGAT